MNDEYHKALNELLFIAESIAHLRGMEREILPAVDKVRKFMKEEENKSYCDGAYLYDDAYSPKALGFEF